jgi:hypothetical protein
MGARCAQAETVRLALCDSFLPVRHSFVERDEAHLRLGRPLSSPNNRSRAEHAPDPSPLCPPRFECDDAVLAANGCLETHANLAGASSYIDHHVDTEDGKQWPKWALDGAREGEPLDIVPERVQTSVNETARFRLRISRGDGIGRKSGRIGVRHSIACSRCVRTGMHRFVQACLVVAHVQLGRMGQ